MLVIEFAENVPYNVQMLAHFVWNKVSDLKDGAFYTQIWNSLTANQKKALAAVITENGQNLLSKNVTDKAKMSVSTIQSSLKSLTAQDILRQNEKRRNGRISI